MIPPTNPMIKSPQSVAIPGPSEILSFPTTARKNSATPEAPPKNIKSRPVRVKISLIGVSPPREYA